MFSARQPIALLRSSRVIAASGKVNVASRLSLASPVRSSTTTTQGLRPRTALATPLVSPSHISIRQRMSGKPEPSKTWGADLSGKCIIVTGGNRGIGLATSRQLAQAGAHVAIIYNSHPEAPQRAEEIANEFGVKCKAYQQSTEEQKDMIELIREVYKDIGPVGGIVCNAGVAVSKPALEMKREDFDKQFEVNVWGVFNACQACAFLWKEHGYQNGRIAIVSSISAKITNKDSTQCFYNPSKAAVSMLGKCLAMEWRDMGVTVNMINPGVIETDMTSGMFESGKINEINQMTFLDRPGQPDEIAGMAVFLMSDHSSYMTGSEVLIDGGMTSW